LTIPKEQFEAVKRRMAKRKWRSNDLQNIT